MSISPSIVKNLEIISQLRIYDKLNTNDEILYIDSGYMLQCLVRYYYGCNRTNTIKRLTEICEIVEQFFYSNCIRMNDIREIINPPSFTGSSKNVRAKKLKYRASKKIFPPEIVETGKILLELVPKSIIGIGNLIETYKADDTIRTELEKVKTRLEAILV